MKPLSKKCNDCGAVKPIDQFYRVRKGFEYRKGHCCKCAHKRVSAWMNKKAAENIAAAEAAAKQKGSN